MRIETQKEHSMKEPSNISKQSANRRSFLKNGLTAAGAATMVPGLLGSGSAVFGQVQAANSALSTGDAAILRFLAAAEILESDLWIQYNELGGIQDKEVPGGSGSAEYTKALAVLDADMAQ